ncbi:MAG: ATP synthase F1 subunit gamma [Verrucomicrobia bacterium GWC2_42_7]|nr:MAG: ATP synthase F1 subunit gamma [Verrucomicrobia bacterium GWC2_42_7]
MKGIREIRHRIKSIKNTAKITRAMQLVSASKMKKAQDKALGGRPYATLFAEIAHSLSSHLDRPGNPLLESRPIEHRGVLIVTTDRGLCGPLNHNITRQISQMESSTKFIAIGKKATQYLARTGKNMIASFSITDHVSYKDVRTITTFLVEQFLAKNIDTVEVLYPSLVNTAIQEPVIRNLLPIKNFERELEFLYRRMGVNIASLPKDDRFMLMEPSKKALVDKLPLTFFNQSIFQILLEMKASEHSARMVAMKNATDNAESIVSDLTLEYNKARQASITQEIIEIAASQQASKEQSA